MKYKIKNTGEIIEVIQCDIDGNNIIYTDVKGVGNNPYLNLYKDCEKIFEDKIDWEERRYQISKEVVSKLCVSMEVGQHSNNKGIDVMAAARLSIDITDELIRQLKR